MSNTINNSRDSLPSHIQEVKLGGTGKELQRNPILKIWLAIATFFKKEQVKSEVESQQDLQAPLDYIDSAEERYYYTRFTDRVDPSLYYTIFQSKKL
ncbi:hypothetical protein [Scytonema sp. NUACC26]|uniref:hypothetical protein n=1 Tax=Scytonema sp. NUACC26 TaxID=3140176 RepID=UPI0034DB8E8A